MDVATAFDLGMYLRNWSLSTRWRRTKADNLTLKIVRPIAGTLVDALSGAF